MFGIGFPELVVIFIVALLVLGPERLPQVAKSFVRWVYEFRRAADELKKELGAEELIESRTELQRVHQELLKKVYIPPPPPEPQEVKKDKLTTTSHKSSSEDKTSKEVPIQEAENGSSRTA